MNNTCCHSDGVDKAFREVSVYPIWNVERSVDSEGSQIMCRDSLCLSGALEHEKLGKDSNGLEEDGERPQDFRKGELVVEYEGEDEAWTEQVFDAEGVNGGVMRWSIFVLHEVENVAAACDEEELHDGVV